MREFDHNGLLLAKYQGEIFEDSVDKCDCSSLNFVKWFVSSEIAQNLDTNESCMVYMFSDYAINKIKEKHPKPYGNDKYNHASMFWLGYMYRYISYTRDVNTRFVYDYFKPSLLLNNYYTWHTQSEEYVIRSMLELLNLDEKIFDKHFMLKQQILKRDYYQRTIK